MKGITKARLKQYLKQMRERNGNTMYSIEYKK
jgi:hypothetical protein